jgi:RNA ligase (TIGR02306 family)
MERKLVTVETISDIQPIPDADKICKAKVRNWWVIIGKDQFNVGDKCLYFEIDSLLPIDKFDESLSKYNSTRTMITEDGKEITGYRIRTVKMRGQISQGLILPYNGDEAHGTDMTNALDVVKYDPYISNQKGAQLQSDNGAEGLFPSFIPKTDEERIQNLDYYNDIDHNIWEVSEKLDGTSFTAYRFENEFKVCSRNLILREDENSIYWKIAKKYNMRELVPEGFAVQGEIVGPGIQSNPLKLKETELYLFNMYNINEGTYLDRFNLSGIKQVPFIEIISMEDTSIDDLINKVDGVKSKINPSVYAEGFVYKRFENGNKISFKIINNKFLLKER